MKGEPDFLQNLRDEMGGGRQWLDRAAVIAHAVLAGLAVVGTADLDAGHHRADRLDHPALGAWCSGIWRAAGAHGAGARDLVERAFAFRVAQTECGRGARCVRGSPGGPVGRPTNAFGAGGRGGIFGPSLSLGAGVARLPGSPRGAALIALGMCRFLAAVTQTPITAMIIVMEMTDGHSMVLNLMACALLASLVSRMISRPLCSTMSLLMMRSLHDRTDAGPNPEPFDCQVRAVDRIGQASAIHSSTSVAPPKKMPVLPQALMTKPPRLPPAKMPSDISVL
jgi:hypothetical protein